MMKVILTERIKSLGNIGDITEVKDGYARNFLLPQKKAMPATEANMALIQSERAQLEAQEQARREAAESIAKSLEGVSLKTTAMASDEGKLYGSIGAHRVLELLAEQGCDVQAQQINMPSESIRQVGDYVITLSLHSDVSCEVPLQVASESV